jgi:N-acetylmuramoyl-L-alanine amidase
VPVVLAVAVLSPAAAGAASKNEPDIQAIRLWAGPKATRVVLDVSAPVSHSLFSLNAPARVVVDIGPSRLSLSGIPEGNGLVRQIRSARRPEGGVRVVLDLTREARARSFLMPPGGGHGHRLVIDLEPQGAGRAPVVTHRLDSGRQLVIAIDAGHGGQDPGALGRRGTREKNITLQIARRLASLIDAEAGMRAVMIRDGDYYLSLRKRIEKAREHRADLFVSIHADAFKNTTARGSSVYVLSSKGATDEAARWLAARENAADLVGGVSLDDKDQVLASVLLDLSQTAAIGASMEVGEHVLAGLQGVGKLHKHSVQQAGFAVLKSPDIPSILVETAFISNPEEERLLTSKQHQQRVASAIVTGVRRYFEANPPPGTWLAENRAGRRGSVEHVISRGDTLSGIADRYNVSLGDLRRQNRLRHDRIRIGQVLVIPAPGS